MAQPRSTTDIQNRSVPRPHQSLLIPRKPLTNRAASSVNTKPETTATSDTQHHKPVPPSRRKRHSHLHNPFTHSWWAFEFVATILSFATFTALIVVLKVYDNQPQRQWTYSYLTLNGLVAILATITRAALLIPVAAALSQSKWVQLSSSKRGMPKSSELRDLELFDQASRGAWGGLQLLWAKKGLHLASIGALLMIFALAFDTFSQQVLSIQYREIGAISSGSLPTIPRTELLDISNPYLNSSGQPNYALRLLINNAVTNGILPEEILDPSVSCPTGNCTWPVFPSLGVCGGCTDITSTLKRVCDGSTCYYNLPGGFTNGPDPFDARQTPIPFVVASGTTGSVYNSTGSGWSGTEGYTYPPTMGQVNDVPLYLLNFVTIGVPWQASITANASATECALWACVQRYSVSVHDGRQSQEITSTWTRTRNPSFPISSQLTSEGGPLNPGLASEGAQGHVTFVDIPSDYNVLPNANFTITGDAWNTLNNYALNPMFETLEITGTQGQEPTALAVWQGSTDWDSWIENLAQSLSNQLRLSVPTTNDPQSHYAGQAYFSVAFVKVRWAWIAFPAFMVLASLVFLVMSMWQTRRSSVYAWKDSTLALLALDLDEDIAKDAAGSVNVPGELGRRIGKKRVYLDNGEGEWKLSIPI